MFVLCHTVTDTITVIQLTTHSLCIELARRSDAHDSFTIWQGVPYTHTEIKSAYDISHKFVADIFAYHGTMQSAKNQERSQHPKSSALCIVPHSSTMPHRLSKHMPHISTVLWNQLIVNEWTWRWRWHAYWTNICHIQCLRWHVNLQTPDKHLTNTWQTFATYFNVMRTMVDRCLHTWHFGSFTDSWKIYGRDLDSQTCARQPRSLPHMTKVCGRHQSTTW